MSALQPVFGKITFESEGTEQGPFHSRRFHVPTPRSGLTIGRGYDMKMKNSFKINQDLVAAGISSADAKLIAQATGLFGSSAKAFIKTYHLEKFEITQQQQVKLFNISYKEEEAETKRLCTKPDVIAKYGQCNWRNLDTAIKQILVDLKFRGDYTGSTRKFIQKHVVTNDTKAFLQVLSNRNNWVNQRVPTNRFQKRIIFFKTHAVIKP
ncbi:hypothetical protein MNBD_GAMMA04-1169 [hydrothermal vent metagenome]|uniref:Pesticin C-terminal domain-containing protein n=1 Tax=hydrothermal vent metagenome TaxID=652676 RepID=A0A3B0X1N7_9ZZZZ